MFIHTTDPRAGIIHSIAKHHHAAHILPYGAVAQENCIATHIITKSNSLDMSLTSCPGKKLINNNKIDS